MAMYKVVVGSAEIKDGLQVRKWYGELNLMAIE